MKQRKRNWIIGIIVGFCLAAGAYWWAYPRYFSSDAKLARKLGVDPSDLSFVYAMGDKQVKRIPLTEAELNGLRTIMNSSGPATKQDALLCYYSACKKGDIPMDFQAFRAKLSDTEPGTRLLALNSLNLLHDPTIKTLAQQMSNDIDNSVRNEAREILEGKADASATGQKRKMP